MCNKFSIVYQYIKIHNTTNSVQSFWLLECTSIKPFIMNILFAVISEAFCPCDLKSIIQMPYQWTMYKNNKSYWKINWKETGKHSNMNEKRFLHETQLTIHSIYSFLISQTTSHHKYALYLLGNNYYRFELAFHFKTAITIHLLPVLG